MADTTAVTFRVAGRDHAEGEIAMAQVPAIGERVEINNNPDPLVVGAVTWIIGRMGPPKATVTLLELPATRR